MGIIVGCKIIDFCAQKSVEIVGIHSVEAGRKAWHGSAYIVSMHLLHSVVTSLYIRLLHTLYPCVSAFKKSTVISYTLSFM